MAFNGVGTRGASAWAAVLEAQAGWKDDLGAGGTRHTRGGPPSSVSGGGKPDQPAGLLSPLRELDMSSNQIGAPAAMAFAAALRRNRHLLALRLGFNPLGFEATKSLIAALGSTHPTGKTTTSQAKLSWNSSLTELAVENTLGEPPSMQLVPTAVSGRGGERPEEHPFPAADRKYDPWQPRKIKKKKRKGKGKGKGKGKEAKPVSTAYASAAMGGAWGAVRPGTSANERLKQIQGNQSKSPGRAGPSPKRGTGASPRAAGAGSGTGTRLGGFPPGAAAGVTSAYTGDGPPRIVGESAVQALWELANQVLAHRTVFASIPVEWPEKTRVPGALAARLHLHDGEGEDEDGKHGWGLRRSVFRPRLLESDGRSFFDTPALLARAFEADWQLTKADRVVRDDSQRASVKRRLRQYYPVLREAFRFWASSSVTDPHSMSLNQFTMFRHACSIQRADREVQLDMVFISSNYEEVSDAANPDHALCRFEFIEAVLRLALIMFPPADSNDGPSVSVQKLFHACILPTVRDVLGLRSLHDPWSNLFRRKRLYAPAVDRTFRVFLAPLQRLF